MNDSPTSINAKCFTSWHFSNEITDKIVAITTVSSMGSWVGEYTTNGVYVRGNNNQWHSSGATNPWIQYDFGTEVTIQKVIIKVRIVPTTYFENVEVRVGKTSASGDFSQFRLLDKFPDLAGIGEVVVFESPRPLRGRYLSVQSIKTGTYMSFGSINVLGEA